MISVSFQFLSIFSSKMNGKLQIALVLVVALFLLMNSVDARERRTQKRNGKRTNPRSPKNEPKKQESAGQDKKDDKTKQDGKTDDKGNQDGKTDNGNKDNGDKDNNGGGKGGKCADKGKNCKDLIGHCTDSTFEASLKKHCALTCGYCAPPQNQCKDVAGDQCTQMKQKGFCGSSAHSVEMQRMFCAKTCELCAK